MSSIAPVEYLIIGFPGNQFNGEIVPALTDLVQSGAVRILDLIFITKDEDGEVTAFEYDELDALMPLGAVAEESMGLLNDEDVEMAAETLENNSSAAFLVWEDLWASRFAAAVRDSGGVFIAGERIPHDIVQAAIDQSIEQGEI
jgi:uncharacterized membrane protein